MENFKLLSDFIIPIIIVIMGTVIASLLISWVTANKSNMKKYVFPFIIGIGLGLIAAYWFYDNTLKEQLEQEIVQTQKEMELQHAVILEKSKRFDQGTVPKVKIKTILELSESHKNQFNDFVMAYHNRESSRKAMKNEINRIKPIIKDLATQSNSIK